MRSLSTPARIVAMHAMLNTLFFTPVIVAYYSLKGADSGTFLLLQGLFRIAVLLLEVPTGYLADQWSRRAQLRIAALIWLAGYTILLGSTSVWGLLGFELTMALSIAFRSGTLEAYLHESLRAEGRLHQQAAWQGHLFMAAMGGQAVASAIGAGLYTLAPNLPVVATMVTAGAGLLLSWGLPQVRQERGPRRHANPLHELWLVVHHSLRQHPRLPWLLLGPWPLFGYTGLLFWSLQTQLPEVGLSVLTTGLAVSGYQLLMAVSASRTGAILSAIGPARLLQVLVLLLVVGTALVATASPWLIWAGVVLGAGVVHNLGKPVSITLINQETPDHERATVLSVGSMVSQTMGAILMLAAKPLLPVIGMPALLAGALVVTLLLAGYPLWRLTRA